MIYNRFLITANLFSNYFTLFPNVVFDVFKQMNPDQLQIIIQCIMWGMEHYEGAISETSAQTLHSLLSNIRQDRKVATKFYHAYLKIILQKLLQTMTDDLHKSVFPLLCDILRQICVDIQNPNVCDDLMASSTSGNGGMTDEGGNTNPNVRHVGQLWSKLLSERFPNLTQQDINNFIMNCFKIALQTKDTKPVHSSSESENAPPFMQQCQDLLVQIKEVHQIKKGSEK